MTGTILAFPGGNWIFVLALLLLCLCSPARAQRKDVVIMNNGDHFTGRIKRLENGLLFVETDYVSGDIGFDWNQVQSIESAAIYQIVLSNGQRLEGRIEKASSEKGKTEDFLIRETTEEVQIPSTTIAGIDIKKPTFWRQLKGDMDLGYSFTSGNSQSALNTDTSVAYQTTGWKVETSFDATFSGQAGASETNREDVQATVSKFLNRNSFVSGLSDFLHSSQQDLNLRTTLGGGYGHYLKRTTNSNLTWLAGVVYMRESFGTNAGNPSDQNVEAVGELQYNYVRFNFGEMNSQVRVFPGLTDAGRVRVTTNNSVTIKLKNNFHLSFTFWDNFDSQPPPTAKKNELGISSGIGWFF
jgi:hypothetical protein